MKTLKISPTVSVNDIPFGADRDIVRNAFGEYREFKKNKFSKNTTDDFGGFHVFYTDDNKFDAIEIFDVINETEVYVNDKKLNDDFCSVKGIFSDIYKDENGYISINSSVGITEECNKIESVLFASKGYY